MDKVEPETAGPLRYDVSVPFDAASASGDRRYMSLIDAVQARKEEFTRPRSIRIKVATWNVGAYEGTEQDVGAWFVGSNDSHAPSAGPDADIYALGLQEIVDLSSATEALRPYVDPAPSAKFKATLASALPHDYQLVAEHQLVGLLLLIYASHDVTGDIRSVASTGVGTGLMGYMGNKGAVAAEIVLGEDTRVNFINCHMSSGNTTSDLQRRNWDALHILSRTSFTPTHGKRDSHSTRTTKIGEEDVSFWFGDLNYRIEGVPPEDVRRILTLHTRNEYDVSRNAEPDVQRNFSKPNDAPSNPVRSPEHSLAPALGETGISVDIPPPGVAQDIGEARASDSDPGSLQATIDSLLPHDELFQQQKLRSVFQDGWKEGRITFLPTYKYDRGRVGDFDSSEKRRGPSWCDRILYRTRNDKLAYDELIMAEKASRERDAVLTTHGVDTAARDEEEMLFEYDPETDGETENPETTLGRDDEVALGDTITEDSTDAILALESYDSAQRIVSSDHKPLIAVFLLKYQAAVPELKSKVQDEIARQLDKAENENRPSLTIVADGNSLNDGHEVDGLDFGDVRYDESKHRSLTVANTGSTPAIFGFAKRHQSDPTPEWLELYASSPPAWSQISQKESKKAHMSLGHWADEVPEVFYLEPGSTCDFQLRLLVSEVEHVRKLNLGEMLLDDVVVIRVKDGRDYFLAVRGTWLQSSHGMTVDQLVRIPEGGVRRWQQEFAPLRSRFSPTNPTSSDLPFLESTMWSAPREIFRLTESIEGLVVRIAAEWSMLNADAGGQESPWESHVGWPFAKESWTLDKATLRSALVDASEALDTDQPFEKTMSPDLLPIHRLEALAYCMLTFLKNLADGVITSLLWSRVQAHFSKSFPRESIESERAAVLELLSYSRSHSISFVLITTMLSRIASELSQTAGARSAGSGSASTFFRGRPTKSANPATAHHQLMLAKYASVFAEIVVRCNDTNQIEKRKLLELFLDFDTG